MGSFKRPAFIATFVVSVVASVLLCRLPLLETLGYEYALATALLLSLFAGISSAALPSYFRRQVAGRRPDLLDMYFLAAAGGLLTAFASLTVSLVNGVFFVPFCNLSQGLVFFAMMPIFSALLASAMGLAVGLLTRSAVRAVLLFILVFLMVLLGGLYTFYSSPAVFVFNPFAGYFPGVLYDRIIRPDFRLVTFRIGTLIEILAILCALAALYDPERITLSSKRFDRTSGITTAAFGFVFLAAAFHLLGSFMGHRSGRHDLEAALPRHVATDRLDLYFPWDTDSKLINESVRDAVFCLQQISSYFEVKPQHRIAVFVFRDAAEKARLMGAGDTNVAKPWRREVYVTLERPPHSVLRHELVHAVSADFAPGPFAVAGKWHGIVPNPGLIEGLATAAGGQRGDLTVHQWARAMMVIGLLPSVETLVGLGFFDLDAASAYTAAGSFCDWMKQRFGSAVLIRAYQSGDFESAAGKSLRVLENEWKVFLTNTPLIEADKAAARARFDKQPIIRTQCVHATAELCALGREKSAQGDTAAAERLFQSAHQKSGGSSETKRQLFLAANEAGDWQQVRDLSAEALRVPGEMATDKNVLHEMLLDLDMSVQKDRPYAEGYETLAAEADTEERRRLLAVKAHLARTGVDNPRIFDVLSYAPGARSVNSTLAALLIAEEAAAKPDDPVRAYLLARQFFNAEDFSRTLAILSRAESLGLSSSPEAIRLAARFMKGDALAAHGQFDDATLVFGAIAADAGVREGFRSLARDRADRAMFYKSLRNGCRH